MLGSIGEVDSASATAAAVSILVLRFQVLFLSKVIVFEHVVFRQDAELVSHGTFNSKCFTERHLFTDYAWYNV